MRCECCGGKLEPHRDKYCTKCVNYRGYICLKEGIEFKDAECWHKKKGGE